MKKCLLWLVAVAVCQFAVAQNIRINQNSYQKVTVSFETGELSVSDVSVPEGDFSLISLPGYGNTYAPGMPQLPQLAKMLQIPVCDSVVATVTNAQYVDYDAAELGIHHPLFPSQESVSKAKENPPFAYNSLVYHTDALVYFPLVHVEKAGIKRNVALANLYVSPVQYNPYKQKIRIYTRFDVEFTFVNADMAKTVELQKFASPMFTLDEDMVINKMQETRNEYSTAPIKYLIIGNAMFADNENLAAFVSWKRRLGYIVEVAFTNQAGVGSTTSSIKSFIQSKYDNASPSNPAPTFVLLLGDREQLPAFTGQSDNSHITDLYYATLSGTDFLPDCYYGRMSATNNSQLSNQIEKIMMYEQYSMPDPSYLGNAVLIAGTDASWAPTHANGQVNYVTNNYMNSNNPRYTNVMAHLYNCSSQAAQIRSEVSNGVGWANYTAHGSETSWADPSFTTSHVAQLQNTNKYGLMIGNCCQSGNFKTSECFGEALLRAEKKGAMGYIGASNNSYWDEDFYWAVGVRSSVTANPSYNANALGMYDKVFHTHGEDYSVWVSTIAGIMTGGNMAVQSSSSSRKQYYWEIYHCFGDPSVRVYMGLPSQMTVTANSVITTGSTSYSATVAPYAYVALTRDTLLIATAFANADGDVTLALPQWLDPGDCELVALAQNYIPYFQNVQVITPNGPYVIPTLVEVAENAVFNEGATVSMNLSLANVGVSNASQVYATLTPNTAVTMLQDSIFLGGIAANVTENRANAFSFVMPASEDYANLPFTLKVHWQDTVITRSVNVRVKLPKVVLKDYRAILNYTTVSSFHPGDQVVFAFTSQNAGHAPVGSGQLDLTCNYSGVQVLSPLVDINGMQPNAISEPEFTVKIADTVPDKSLVPLYYHTTYNGIHNIDTIYIMVGGAAENFESGDFSQNNWTMNNYPWILTSSQVHAGGYCARSAQSLPNNSKSRMSVTTNSLTPSTVSFYRKVSSESGYDKFFFYVDGTAMHEASGTASWELVSVDLTAGSHTLMFSYEKDYSQASGSDCAWIDDIVLPCTGILVIEDIVDPTNVGVTAHESVRAKVYPNPTSEWVTVESENHVGQVVLYDMNGRVVSAQRTDGGACRVNMQDLPAGFYMMTVTFENGDTQTLKIIKQ